MAKVICLAESWDSDLTPMVSSQYTLALASRRWTTIYPTIGRTMDEIVLREVQARVKDQDIEVSLDTPLIGDARIMDSLGLVELCLRLEDRASELGFEFDWTSEEAMSRNLGMFRTVGALQSEFTQQASGRE
jgi:acyl carrier protein